MGLERVRLVARKNYPPSLIKRKKGSVRKGETLANLYSGVVWLIASFIEVCLTLHCLLHFCLFYNISLYDSLGSFSMSTKGTHMAITRTQVLHEPQLDTILMVEQAILNADDYPTRTELWKSLPRKMQYQTFKRVLDYLEASGKIAFDKRRIIYTGVNTPKLEALMKSSVRIR
jgi:hypothetical protein